MADPMPRVDVVATVIHAGESILLVRNPNWGFTLPMTKLRKQPVGMRGENSRWELGVEAAMRNAGECLGTTSTKPAGLLADVAAVRQSDRSGEIKQYQFQVYGLEVEGQRLGPGVAGEWLVPDEVLNPQRQPVSATARLLVDKLKEAALKRDGHFPPTQGPPRESVASIALISRQGSKRRQWLCQWNDHWERYFLVGGHQKEGEDASACLEREMQEELGLQAGDDYKHQPHPRPLEPFVDWSTGAWQWTRYHITPFLVTLQTSASAKIEDNAANRWTSDDEIRSERCEDGKLISPTARKLLTKLGEIHV